MWYLIGMNKRILIGCSHVPGWGGPGTASYPLFEMMQSDGLDVVFINFVSGKDYDNLSKKFGNGLGNPKALSNVHTFIIDNYINLSFQNSHLSAFLEDLSPDIIIGITWRAAFLMKRAAPQKTLIFLPSGSLSLKTYLRKSQVKSFVEVQKKLLNSGLDGFEPNVIENEAVKISDLTITHSESILFLFKHLFPNLNDKIYPEILWWTEWTCSEALKYSHFKKPFEERDIDLLFVTNDWTRPEKNYRMMKEIIKMCNDLDIHIVGEINERPDRAILHNFIARQKDLFHLMGRAKVLVSPSLFDASPGILYEAAVLGCNLVVSKNCGNWRICNDNLLVHTFNANSFLKKIDLAVKQKFTDNLDFFIQSKSYQKLKNVIAEF